MLELTRNTQIPTVEQTLSILQSNNQIRPIYIDYDKTLMNIYAIQRQLAEGARKFEDLAHQVWAKEHSLEFYIAEKNIANFFKLTDTGRISLSDDSISEAIDNPLLPPDVIPVLELYQEMMSLLKIRSTLCSLLQNPISDQISCDYHRMLEIRPEWAPQNTGRVAMRKPAIQNLDRRIQELLTCPKGFKLIHCDSGQVEPRITYSAYIKDPQIKTLINLYDDAYYGLYHFCMMPQSYIDSGTLNFEKMEITDDLKAGRKKIKTYGNAVMYGSKKEEDNVKTAMTKRIGNHPARLAMINNAENQIKNGVHVFPTYFGTPIDINNSEKLSRVNTIEQRVRLAINNPIQGTAADLMRYSVYQANRLIMSTKNSSIVCYIHDAGIFCVEEDEYDRIGKPLEDIVAYQVDDWIPVHAEAEVYQFSSKGAFTEYKY